MVKFLQTKKMGLRLSYLYLKVFFLWLIPTRTLIFLTFEKPNHQFTIHMLQNVIAVRTIDALLYVQKRNISVKKRSPTHTVQKCKDINRAKYVSNFLIRLFVSWNGMDDHTLLLAHLWAWGHGDWSPPSFGSHINPILTRGHILPTLYWRPHQVLVPVFKTHSQIWPYFISYLLTCEVDLFEVLDIMAQMWHYIIF